MLNNVSIYITYIAQVYQENIWRDLFEDTNLDCVKKFRKSWQTAPKDKNFSGPSRIIQRFKQIQEVIMEGETEIG